MPGASGLPDAKGLPGMNRLLSPAGGRYVVPVETAATFSALAAM